MKIAIVYIAIGSYARLWEDFHASCEHYFCVDEEKNYELFTDSEKLHKITCSTIHIHKINNEEWIMNASCKSACIHQNRYRFRTLYDYIFYVNSNMLFTNPIYCKEILPNASQSYLTALSFDHCRSISLDNYPYEQQQNCQAYIPFGKRARYYRDIFYGGRTNEVLLMSEWITNAIAHDTSQGIIAENREESYLNRYLLDHNPHILNEEYAHYIDSAFAENYKAIILDKENSPGSKTLLETENIFREIHTSIISLSGGLGNQMFQYAFTLYIRSLWKKKQLWLLNIDKAESAYQGYELSTVFSISDMQPISENLQNSLKHFPVSFINVISEKKVSAIQNIIEADVPVTTINGDWRCYAYIEACASEIRRSFIFQESKLNTNSIQALQRIKQSNAVAIHIRRSNYCNRDNKYIYSGICNYNYYQHAIQKLEKQIEKPLSYFFFSDDTDWVKAHFNNANYHIIDWNKAKDNWQDMCLMVACKHHIIANSSFSWWGAWLGTWPGQCVIAPSVWYNTIETPDILPPNWQTISILPDNELLRELSDELLLNSSFFESPGLLNGKMGSVLFFFHYARYTQNTLYEEYANELLDIVCQELTEETPTNFSNGLCGIGWGIEYLAQNGFIDCNTNEVLADIDRKVTERNPKRMIDCSFETGLEGIACYVQMRGATTELNSALFDTTYLTDLEAACTQKQIPFRSNDYMADSVFERVLSWSGRLYPEKLLKWQIGIHILKRQR